MDTKTTDKIQKEEKIDVDSITSSQDLDKFKFHIWSIKRDILTRFKQDLKEKTQRIEILLNG